MIDKPAALSVSGLHVRYGKREVLRGLDLSVATGEIYGLLGPNGAGKTTLIRTICGRVKPIAGSVLIAGRPVSRVALRHIGLVPQEIALYTHLTARENLEAFGRLSGLGRTETTQAIAWASKATNLAHRLNERIDILSGGWKRRVNIAAAILHRPALLILDEPTVGVDVDARNDLHEVIQQLSHAGMGVLLATHDLDQAETLCSRVGFLSGGIVSPQGPPRSLITDVFRGQRQIVLELRHVATAHHVETLEGAGFSASNGGLTWSMLGNVTDSAAGELSIVLDQAGISTREVRFREPGLDNLFLSLSRQSQVSNETKGSFREPTA